MNRLRAVIIGLMGISVLAAGVGMARRGEAPGERERIDKLFLAGNYKDAYEGYRRLALDAKAQPDRVASDLNAAAQCLVKLGRIDELDAFREAVIAVHSGNLELLRDAALSYLNDGEHQGFVVAGKFQRGQHRGGGHFVDSYERDRARALQLLVRGLDRARTDPNRALAGRYLLAVAEAAMGDRGRRIPGGSSPSRRSTSCPTTTRARTGTGSASRPPAHPSSPTGRPSITGYPPASTRRRTTASAGDGAGPGRRARPR